MPPPVSLPPPIEAGLGEFTSAEDMIKSGLSAIEDAKSSREGKSWMLAVVANGSMTSGGRLLLVTTDEAGPALFETPASV